MKIPVFIFSYNRGKFLENAIASVRENFPASDIVVMDDNSDDPETKKIIGRIKDEVQVFVQGEVESSDSTGGLHANMNTALNLAEEFGANLALFLQDDQQIVRKVSEGELERMEDFFFMPRASFVVNTCFMKKGNGSGLDRLLPYGEFFIRDPELIRFMPTKSFAYADTGIFSIAQCRATLGVLLEGERNNEVRAQELGLQLGFLRVPFMHFLPFPISFKKKGRGLSTKLADIISGAGIHTYSTLDEATVALLEARDPALLAYGEDWLIAPTAPKSDSWSLTGGMSNLVHRGGWRRHLAELYFKLR